MESKPFLKNLKRIHHNLKQLGGFILLTNIKINTIIKTRK